MIHVVYAINYEPSYIDICKKSIDTVKWFVKDDIQFHILINGEEPIEDIEGIHYHFKVPTNLRQRKPYDDMRNTSYLRMWIPELLPNDIDKCIYLDSDVLVIHDFSKWYHETNPNYLVCHGFNIPLNEKKLLNLKPNELYVQPSIMLMNIPALRQDDFRNKVFENMWDVKAYWCHEETLLNYNYRDKIDLISPKLMRSLENKHMNKVSEILFCHFNGPFNKPILHKIHKKLNFIKK